jgi:hypothetical protein
MSNSNPPWFNIECNINTLEARNILEQKEELDIQLQEIEDSIALLKLCLNTSTNQCTAKFFHPQLGLSIHKLGPFAIVTAVNDTPLTRLQVEEENKKDFKII